MSYMDELNFWLNDDYFDQKTKVGNTPEEVTKLEKTSDIFLEWIQTDTSADWKAEKLSVVSSRDMTRMAAGETQNAETIESRADAAQLYRLAKGFLQAVADSSGK